MTTRRNILGALASFPFASRYALAQAKPPLVIGYLDPQYREQSVARLGAFKEGMAALGWKEGIDYVLEERWSQGNIDRLPALAAEIAAKKPVVIVANTSPAAQAAHEAAPMTPVVMPNGDPQSSGLVANLARPGGMITGMTNINTEITSKLIELMHDIAPRLHHVGCLGDGGSTSVSALLQARSAAARFRIKVSSADAKTPGEIEPTLTRLAKAGVDSLVVLSSPWLQGERRRILKFPQAQRWAVFASQPEFADAGALLTYGADRVAMYRRAAAYVDKILKGTKPGDLPIEQPTTFELAVNMKTAKALGIKIPNSILVQATKVIE